MKLPRINSSGKSVKAGNAAAGSSASAIWHCRNCAELYPVSHTGLQPIACRYCGSYSLVSASPKDFEDTAPSRRWPVAQKSPDPFAS